MTPYPQTFSAWEFIIWLRENEDELHVQVQNPVTKELELEPLASLPPREWAFHGQRLFMDPRHPCKPLTEWDGVSLNSVTSPPGLTEKIVEGLGIGKKRS